MLIFIEKFSKLLQIIVKNFQIFVNKNKEEKNEQQ